MQYAKTWPHFYERQFFAESDSAIRFSQLALDFMKFWVEIPKKSFFGHLKTMYIQADTLISIYFSYIVFIKTSTLSLSKIKNISSFLKGEFGFLYFKLILGSSEYIFKYFYVVFWDSTSTASLKICSGYRINISYTKNKSDC